MPYSTSDPFNLARFEQAHEGVYELALTEIRQGQKRSHWMWFIFPQLSGLGHSSNAMFFAIKSREEANAYLEHPILGERLRECCKALMAVEGKSANHIFGSPDDMKLRSSATLFAAISPAGSIFEQVLDKYYAGIRDSRTLELLSIEDGR